MSQYYYKLHHNGDKSYYDSSTGRSVQKREIPISIRDSVLPFDRNIHYEINPSDHFRKRRERINDLKDRIDKLLKELELGSDIPDILSSNGIFTKADWKSWLKKNHSDKQSNIDENLLKNIISAGRAIGW